MRKEKVLFCIFIISCVFFFNFAISCAQEEQITITTYYPSPYGSYRELSWGNYPNTRGKLTADQGSSIELGGSGTPYIDFSNDASSDYDARIILTGNDQLAIRGITRINICVLVSYSGGITYCPSCYYVSSFLATASASGYMVCCMVETPPTGSGC
ncbi:MAG: hypothetical protein QME65_02375 [Candidatus Omnitrophota bacterium]|nr:hypothetical protein [Candidatus Omnitrophota bacterium]